MEKHIDLSAKINFIIGIIILILALHFCVSIVYTLQIKETI